MHYDIVYAVPGRKAILKARSSNHACCVHTMNTTRFRPGTKRNGYTRAHTGVDGNDVVDQFAKMGAHLLAFEVPPVTIVVVVATQFRIHFARGCSFLSICFAHVSQVLVQMCGVMFFRGHKVVRSPRGIVFDIER